ncbi:hypothetical protein NFI96_019853 [Prochilodus magdalenae]|nr:hypothetical protein NFI96_019853 [Prochilodus magdalenae]
MTRCHSESLHDSLSCVVQPSANRLMEDTTARWRSVMVAVGSGSLITIMAACKGSSGGVAPSWHRHACRTLHTVTLNCPPQVVCQLCEGPCQCPWSSPICPVGIPLVLDGCGCCQMCARQEGEPCSEKHVCDSRRGLQCDYSASFPGEPGECVRQNLLGCELDGVRYEEGQSFQPTCMQLCHCVGGGITCVPLCNEDLNLPIANCPNPRLVQLPGRCCREWVCDGLENSVLLENTAGGNSTHVVATCSKSNPHNNVPTSVPDLTNTQSNPHSNVPTSNVLRPVLCCESLAAEPKSPDGRGPERASRVQRDPPVFHVELQSKKQITEWSACSRSCGPGVSTRMSNRNWACRPQTQTVTGRRRRQSIEALPTPAPHDCDLTTPSRAGESPAGVGCVREQLPLTPPHSAGAPRLPQLALLQAPVLWHVHRRPLLYPPPDQNRPDGLPLSPGRHRSPQGHGHRVVRLSSPLSSSATAQQRSQILGVNGFTPDGPPQDHHRHTYLEAHW